MRSWFDPGTTRAALLLRVAVGGVFLAEGVQKFLYPDALGVGRFTKIGIPFPAVMAPFVGGLEIVGGALLLVGLATRLVCVPLLVEMFVAITSTKLVAFGKNGFWATLHEARTDLLMIFGLIFLLVAGPGSMSVDSRVKRSRRGITAPAHAPPWARPA